MNVRSKRKNGRKRAAPPLPSYPPRPYSPTQTSQFNSSRPSQDAYLPSQPSPSVLPIQDPVLSFLARGEVEVGKRRTENHYVDTPRETSSEEDSLYTYNQEKDELSKSDPGPSLHPRVMLVQCKETPEKIVSPRPAPRTSLLVRVQVQNPQVYSVFYTIK